MIEHHELIDGMRLHPLRATDLTASDIGAVIGVDKYKTPLQLYAEKTGLIMGQADNASMRRGRWLEAAVLSAMREETDLSPYPFGAYLRDPDLRLGATPDAYTKDEVGLINVQCKVVSRPAYERDWADGAPLSYQLQTVTEGMLMDATRSLIAALVIDTYTAELHLYPVPRHEAAEAKVRDIVAQFWANVAAGRRPVADYARDAETITALYPQSKPEPVLDLTGDNRLPDLLSMRNALKHEAADCEREIAAIDTEIKAKLGEAERAELPGWKLSWKTVHRNESITKAYDYRPLIVTAVEEKEQAA